MPYLGETAALLTAGCWAFNSICFTLAGRRVGSQTVNASRLFMALALLVPVHWVLAGSAFPWQAGAARLVPLAVSGLIGFAVGDALLFEAFVLVGARLAMLLMTLSPIFSALLAWALLDQTLGLAKVAAILATLGGIAWVVAEGHKDEGRHPRWALGVLLGVGGALGQSVGLILSQAGMRGGFSPVSANLVRVTAACLAMAAWLLFRRETRTTVRGLADGRATAFIAAGAVTGPVIGVILSLLAITHAPMGVAATLMSLAPVLLLPASKWIFHEPVSPRALFGTALSLAGAAALFWV